MTIEEYLDQYHKEQTTKSYSRVINHFLVHSDRKEQSNYTDIIHYLFKHQFQSGRVLAGLKKYFDYLIDEGIREDHPCKQLTIKRKKTNIQFQQLFTPEELELLLNRSNRYNLIKERNSAIISLLIYQALSPANIVNLKVQDIDVDAGTIYIKQATNLSRRTLELKARQIFQVYRYMMEFRPQLLKVRSDQLFIGKLGQPLTIDGLNRMIRPLHHLFLHKNLNPQTIRQSVISNWLNTDNIPLEDVQLLSGQKWMSSTEKYIRPNAEVQRGKINEFWPI